MADTPTKALEIGKKYFVRTSSDYWVGRLVAVNDLWSAWLEDFAWVADTGRLNEFLREGHAAQMEVEVAPQEEIDGEKMLICVPAPPHAVWITWPHPLFTETV